MYDVRIGLCSDFSVKDCKSRRPGEAGPEDYCTQELPALWWPLKDQHKIKPVTFQHGGVGAHGHPPLSEELLTANSFWGSKS